MGVHLKGHQKDTNNLRVPLFLDPPEVPKPGEHPLASLFLDQDSVGSVESCGPVVDMSLFLFGILFWGVPSRALSSHELEVWVAQVSSAWTLQCILVFGILECIWHLVKY